MSVATPVPPAPPPVEQMAVEPYHKILIYQNPNPSHPWPNQYVSVNGYQVVLPREQEIVIADQLMKEIDFASEGYEHLVQSPTNPDKYIKVRKRRADLNHRVIQRDISPQEADKLRAEGAEVYPKVLTPAARAALQALGKSKKGGSK